MADPVPINEVNPIMSTYPLSSEVKFEAVYDMLHVRDEPEFQNDVTNKEYVDQKIKSSINNLVDGAGEAYDTLLELRDALNDTNDPNSAASLISVITGQVAAEQLRADTEEKAIRADLVAEELRADTEEKAIRVDLAAEELRADTEEKAIRVDLAAEELRADTEEKAIRVDLAAEQKRAEDEEAKLAGLIQTNKTEAETAVQTLTDNKLDRNLLSGIDYGYEEDNITIKSVEVAPVINVKSGVISLGDRWRINCNAGADDVPRLVFEYKKVVDDDTTWVVGIPFIQSMPRS